ncbi:MAG: cellulose biosynthesis cyclic di-GMP-binding regulatory protein BcsB [Vampirovibrionales bacterium]|nr:cellulose biosynthesis cyclic di-GMP-binding regulatory protein BcsB [Vampirovibrionales bacterium]
MAAIDVTKKRCIVGLLAALMGVQAGVPLGAATLSLQDLGVTQPLILLPTIRSQQEVLLTVPKTYQVSGSPMLNLTFQHSNQLDPSRSRLEVLLNNTVVKTLPLTAANAEATKVSIPLTGALKPINRLALRVEQHIPNKCEDPLDAALWTQILPDSTLAINGTYTLPALDLAQFPAPFVDSLAFEHAPITYALPESLDSQTLEAMLILQARLSQAVGLKTAHTQAKLPVNVAFLSGNLSEDQHWMVVSVAEKLPKSLQTRLAKSTLDTPSGRLALVENQWQLEGRVLSKDEGVLLIAPNANQTRAVMIVSGNHAQGVLKAAQYAVSQQLRVPELAEAAPEGQVEPKKESLTQAAVKSLVVSADWSPKATANNAYATYIMPGKTTFEQLGLKTASVEKIVAPPITHKLYNVHQLAPGKQKLFLDAVLSYGPKLNPRYSSLEFRLNDRSIANIPLTNPEGEARKAVTIPVPVELLGVSNALVAQFHLMPDKYGFCVDNYKDEGWGKLHADSAFRLEGASETLWPKLSMLLPGSGYPATQKADLSDLTLILAVNATESPQKKSGPSAIQLETLLSLTDRLSRNLPAGVIPGLHAQLWHAKDALPTTTPASIVLAQAPMALDWGVAARPQGWEGFKWQLAPQWNALLASQTNKNGLTTLLAASNEAALKQLQALLAQPAQLDVGFAEGPVGQLSGDEPVMLLAGVDNARQPRGDSSKSSTQASEPGFWAGLGNWFTGLWQSSSNSLSGMWSR